jgi:hypothetical protein
MKNITHIVVHYSATNEDQEITRNDIDRMHKARGWKGIGYHFFYRLNGMEEIGRPITEVGAHVGGQNRGKIGLCYAGGTKKEFGPDKGFNTLNLAQEKALIQRIRMLKSAFPAAKVVGHKDLAATQCPGFNVQDWWTKVEASNYNPVFNIELPKAKAAVPEPKKTNWLAAVLSKVLGAKK